MLREEHFINAVVERDISRLDPVAVIRLAGGNYARSTPSFIDFPPPLKKSKMSVLWLNSRLNMG
jgi:hypothetical protein